MLVNLNPTNTQTEDEILEQAKSLAATNKWKEASRLLKVYRQANVVTEKFLEQLAFYCSRAGDFHSAITFYKDLCDRQPSVGRWHYALGYQYLQTEKWSDAILSLEKSLSLVPGWLLANLRLGEAYESSGVSEKAVEAYRNGIQNYKTLPTAQHARLAPFYLKLCKKLAQRIIATSINNRTLVDEAITLLRECIRIDQNDANSWYHLGCALLKIGKLNEALDCLSTAKKLDPKKDYVYHKIAQVHLKQGNSDFALKAYGGIPRHRWVPYILHGVAQCHISKGEFMEGAKTLHRAIQKEPNKFYHHWEFSLALAALGAKDQAVKALEQSNILFRREYGKDYHNAIKKLEELRSDPSPSKSISFNEPEKSVTSIRFGTIIKYDDRRAFGFIKDSNSEEQTFFHVTRVKEGKAQIGSRVRYVREQAEKGFQAVKVWLLP